MIKMCRLWGKKNPNNSYFWLSVLSIKFGFLNLNHQKMLLKKQVCYECPRNELKSSTGFKKRTKLKHLLTWMTSIHPSALQLALGSISNTDSAKVAPKKQRKAKIWLHKTTDETRKLPLHSRIWLPLPQPQLPTGLSTYMFQLQIFLSYFSFKSNRNSF